MSASNVIPIGAPQASPGARSVRPAAPSTARVRFDVFELDEPNALLLRHGKAVALAPKPFAVLCALARRPGSLLTKHALLDDVWGHQFVSDSVLKTAVSEVRRVLDDHPRQPRFIETVSRRGYRFVASIAAISTAASVPRVHFSGPPSFYSVERFDWCGFAKGSG
jgi:DNA-binding winged helix-turn-helix (wHTH) protein